MKTFCSYFNEGICSSCTKIQTPYQDQISDKLGLLKNLLAPFAPFDLRPPVLSPPLAFRNKAKFSVTGQLDAPIIGLTGEDDLDQGREILNCPLHHPSINNLARGLTDFIRVARMTPYHIKSRTGELKGLIIYHSSETNESYLRFILRSKESLDRIKKNLPQLQERFSNLTCVSANIQPIPHAVLEGDEEIFFTPNNSIHHKIGEISMNLHPQGFVQTNQGVAVSLYSTAAQWAEELHPQSFIELFSGQGAFSFYVQKFVKSALGIEINQEAVARANETARQLKLDHLQFLAADAAKVEDFVLERNADLMLVNPPRRGLGESINLLQKINSNYLIYSSCNVETLAADLEKLKHKFKIKRVQLFDMFPHTEHFETLVLLESK